MSDRTIMQMEIHPELIRLRKERAERLKWQFAGCQNVGPGGLGSLLMGMLADNIGPGQMPGAGQAQYGGPWRQQ
jgi:hypothetical protein